MSKHRWSRIVAIHASENVACAARMRKKKVSKDGWDRASENGAHDEHMSQQRVSIYGGTRASEKSADAVRSFSSWVSQICGSTHN